MSKNALFYITLISIGIFLLFLPFSSFINFKQNDDWVYYNTVQNFLQNNFVLDNHTEAFLYTMAFLGMIFAKVFGITHLPVLTLVVSVLNFFVFTCIVYKFFLKRLFDSVLVGLLLFLNPIHFYSMLGFMTENYFILFLLVSLYFSLNYLERFKFKDFVLANVVIVVDFFVRQLAVVSSFAFGLALVFKKRYKLAIVQFILFILLILLFHFFPKTADMVQNESFRLSQFFAFNKIIYVFGLMFFYLSVFLFPLFLSVIDISALRTKRNFILFFIFSIFLGYLINMWFMSFSLGTFYPTRSAVSDNGFFYGSLLGEKYHILNANVIYNVWYYIALTCVSMGISLLLILRKNLLNYYVVFILAYVGLLSLPDNFYDRYVLVLIPIFILLLLHWSGKLNTLSRIVLCLFLLFLSYYNYVFGMDFILSNNYLWRRSEKIAATLSPTKILPGYAWSKLNLNPKNDYRYIFSYYAAGQNPKLSCCYSVKESYEIKFPFNLFDKPIIYLYKKNF